MNRMWTIRGWIPLAVASASVALLIAALIAKGRFSERMPRSRPRATGSLGVGGLGVLAPERWRSGDRTLALRERDRWLSLPDDELRSLVDSPEWQSRLQQGIDALPPDSLQGEGAAATLAEYFGPINERVHRLHTNRP